MSSAISGNQFQTSRKLGSCNHLESLTGSQIRETSTNNSTTQTPPALDQGSQTPGSSTIEPRLQPIDIHYIPMFKAKNFTNPDDTGANIKIAKNSIDKAKDTYTKHRTPLRLTAILTTGALAIAAALAAPPVAIVLGLIAAVAGIVFGLIDTFLKP